MAGVGNKVFGIGSRFSCGSLFQQSPGKHLRTALRLAKLMSLKECADGAMPLNPVKRKKL